MKKTVDKEMRLVSKNLGGFREKTKNNPGRPKADYVKIPVKFPRNMAHVVKDSRFYEKFNRWLVKAF